MNFIPQHI